MFLPNLKKFLPTQQVLLEVVVIILAALGSSIFIELPSYYFYFFLSGNLVWLDTKVKFL